MAISVVHKTSTLISSLHVWLLDVATQRMLRQGAVSLRGDTEEAWRRAVGFLLRRGILNGDASRPMLSSPFPAGEGRRGMADTRAGPSRTRAWAATSRMAPAPTRESAI